jgi:polyisoprenoid-binding protein YceI
MIMTPGRYEVGPSNGRMLMRTFRKGVARSAGHDLVIEMTAWSGQIVVGEDITASEVNATVSMDSMSVLEGIGGVKPLTDDDRKDIVKDAYKHLDMAKYPQATFASTGVVDAGSTITVHGQFALRDRTGPVTLELTEAENGTYVATTTIVQSEFGVKPFSAFLGALKIKDEVTLEIELSLG